MRAMEIWVPEECYSCLICPLVRCIRTFSFSKAKVGQFTSWIATTWDITAAVAPVTRKSCRRSSTPRLALACGEHPRIGMGVFIGGPEQTESAPRASGLTRSTPAATDYCQSHQHPAALRPLVSPPRHLHFP